MMNKILQLKYWLFPLLIGLNVTAFYFVRQHFNTEYQLQKKDYAYGVMARHNQRLAESIDTHSIVFLGSSSIQGLDTGHIASGAMNMGIGGETLVKLAARMQTYVHLPKAKALVFMAGFNDVCEGSNLAYRNFANMLKLTQDQAIFVVGMQPAINTRLCAQLSEKLQEYNFKLSSHCARHARCVYIDFAESLYAKTQGDEFLLATFFEEDGIHLNAKGYNILEQNIRTSLAKTF